MRERTWTRGDAGQLKHLLLVQRTGRLDARTGAAQHMAERRRKAVRAHTYMQGWQMGQSETAEAELAETQGLPLPTSG